MSKRSTIGKDPFSDTRADFPVVEETNVVALSAVTAAKEQAKAAAISAPELAAPPRIDSIRIEDAKARRAVGGRLEIFGGDLGAGASVIWRHGSGEHIGFIAPTGQLVDLAAELDNARSWQDRTEHRILSSLGWAWVVGSVGGILGLMAGGGLRLLSPRRMIVQLFLSDGRKLVARTDSVTASGLQALARPHQRATA